MTDTAIKSAKRNRWIDWQPKAQTTGDSGERAPTKPSILSFAGIDGAILARTTVEQVECSPRMVLDRSSEQPTSATVPNVEIRRLPEADLEIGSEFCDDTAVKQLIDAWLVPRLVDEWLANDDPATQPTQPEDNGNP